MLSAIMPERLRLELQCFGAPTARLDGHPAPAQVLWNKHLALLIYLALSPNRTRTRSHLLGLLWPEKDEERRQLQRLFELRGREPAAAYFYPSARSGFFVKGGAGMSSLGSDQGHSSSSNDGVGFVTGLGYECG